MGYTHYWSLTVNDPGYQAVWPQLVADTARIIDAVRRAGITITGPHGTGLPILDPATAISFNGDHDTSQDADTFQLPVPEPGGDQPRWIANFCKTNRQPYDLAVTATLLRAHLLAPHALALSSDGGWDRQWKHGKPKPRSRRRYPSTRGLVAGLFGPIPDSDPLISLDPRSWRS